MPAKGHWPKGKRRSDVAASTWEPLRLAIRDLLRAHRLANVRSYQAIADRVGCDKKTVGRWLNGEDWPPTSAIPILQHYLREQRKLIRRAN
jgi:DNA invertase Pin-like site-specific DNA recombinase